LVDEHTVVATTVHPLQVLDAGDVPTTAHDIHVDLIVTPDEVLRCARPPGWRLPTIDWPELTEEKVGAIPLLGRLRSARRDHARRPRH
jgi:5-formyltetrahydrofolate cyclo-ligase